MKAWMLYDINDLRFEETVKPVLRENEVLVKVKAAGICGSDIPRVFETGAHRHPLIIGHEFSGIVEETGNEVNAGWMHRRVGVFPLLPCKKCASCRMGQFELCRDYDYLGSRRNGGFAEYVSVPAANLIEIPGDVSFEEAAMLEPMAVAVHAIRRATREFSIPGNASVAVGGLGTIGLLVVGFLMEAGYRNIYVVGNKEFQRKQVMSMGIPLERYCDGGKKDAAAWLREGAGGVDFFFECTGRNEVLAWGIDSMNPAGRIVLVGNPHSDMMLGKNIYWKILRNQLEVIGTWNSSFMGAVADDWHYVMNRLEKQGIAPNELITHRLPLGRLPEGLEIMKEKKEEYCKIIIFPETGKIL